MSATPAAKKAKTDDSIQESDMDAAIMELELCHNELDKINEKENEEVIAMDQKFRKLRQESYNKRSKIIEKIPDFWFTVFTGHPDLSNLLTEEEEEMVHFLKKVEVDMAENNAGYSIKFHFKENPHFKNTLLVKEISYKQDKMTSESTKIDWVKAQKKSGAKGGKKRAREEPKSFFEWFAHNSDPANDKIAEIIKDDVWANTIQYYLPDPDMEGEEESNESSEGGEEEEEDEENGENAGETSKAKA